MRDLKPYPEYRDSGQLWIGNVPGHWDILPNRAIFEEVKERNHPNEEMLSVTINRGVIQQKALLENSSKKDSSNTDKSAYKLVCPRDIAYNKMRAWQGAIGASKYRGIISPAYVVMRLRGENSPWYFHQLYRTPNFAKEAERWSYGITSDMWSLRPEHFKMIYTPLPPPDEQTAIVHFLDHVNRRIDRTIKAKRKVIALLNEQKQVIIHRAVTRGLDPNVRLKPSGIQGVDDVPEHWDMPLLGRCLTKIEQGWSPVAAEGELEEGQWAVLTLSSIKRGIFDPLAIKPVSRTAMVPKDIELADGDFLLTRSNTRDRVGDVCLVEGVRSRTIPCDLIYRLHILRHLLLPKFLMYQLLSRYGRSLIERDARGSSGTMPKLSQGHIKSWRMLLPSTVEQQAIIDYIDAELAPISKGIDRIEREIDLLREYRTRLIADVVTGKLDVREAAARLPDEAESLDSDEVLDDSAEIDEMDDDAEGEA
uniref:Restriction endonuclease subunit S n=1 Tax=Geobacter metallireducens TaxID=28232 RepID=A0A831UA99_GEOME